MVNWGYIMRKTKAIEKYITETYGGDESKVQVCELDYSVIKTPNDLAQWAINTFGLTCPENIPNTPRSVIDFVFQTMGEKVKQNYVIRELKSSSIPVDLKDMIYDFKVAISFHFYREYGHRVDFIK